MTAPAPDWYVAVIDDQPQQIINLPAVAQLVLASPLGVAAAMLRMKALLDAERKALIRWGWVYRDAAHKPRASQAQVDLRRLAEKPQWHFHPQTGEKVLDTPQVRVTAKGVAAIADRLKAEAAVT